MAAILKYDVISKALCFYEQRFLDNKKKNNNRIIRDVGPVPDPKTLSYLFILSSSLETNL